MTGQKAKKSTGRMKQSEMMLMASPARPSDQRASGSGTPYKRRHTIQLMVTVYEKSSETTPNELIALSAT